MTKPLTARSEERGKRRIIDFDIEIGRRLRIQRMQRGIAQTDLADAIGITFQQIQKYENGTNRISAGKLVQIANALEVPVAIFFEGLEESSRREAATEASALYEETQAFAATPEGQRLCRAFQKIEKAQTRRLLLRMMESLSSDEEED
ncbi:MAG TPA: helix-turn-helix transcriptional regulator [Rhizomicrobium sp.]|nr:helix-turn-helix transcriptional regulator [Rhizomicrobium sp.]